MKRLSFLLAFALVACTTATVGVRNVEVPRDSAPQCASLCGNIGLPLDSVVIMANNVGCVCRAAPAQSNTAPGASASAGGMAAVMMAEQADQASARRNAAAASHHH